MLKGLRESLPALAALDDEVRRRLYFFVRHQARPVTRDEAAADASISDRLAGFHLDKLVEEGLLQAHFARKPGRSGPGAGRTSKFYEISGIQIDVTIPERHYDFVAHILVAAMAATDRDESPKDAAVRIAAEKGRALGAEIRAEKGRRLGRDRALAAVADALAELGFEPYRSKGKTISLRNCPYHALAHEAPELVCGINRSFIAGVLKGLGASSMRSALEPTRGECCVKVIPGS